MTPATLSPSHLALRCLTAVDGSLLPALPRMAWALWGDEQHRAAKLHLHFEVVRGIPIDASITAGNESETAQLRPRVQAGRLYVLDRLYANYNLLAELISKRASFIVRVRECTAFSVQQERALTPEAQAAGVMREAILARLGTSHHKREIHQPLRLVELTPGAARVLLLTDQLEMPAELVALAYRYRWQVELFFRWLKCVLGCRHWLGESMHALTLPVYVGLIASLLLTLWSRQKPNKRTFEMVCHYFSGWATEQELQAHLQHAMRKTAAP